MRPLLINSERPLGMAQGKTFRKSRFHDEKGNCIDFIGLLYAPVAIGGAIMRNLFDYRPAKPTISFRATKVIKTILQPEFRCIEFGSGMSTVWFASRCSFLLSRETDTYWYKKIKKDLDQRNFRHVQYEFCEPSEVSILTNFEDGFFDFAFVDGWDRAGCIESVLPKIKAGGWLYLDNSDKDMTIPNGDLRRAEEIILSHAEIAGTIPNYFVDFSRTNFFVEQGLLIQI